MHPMLWVRAHIHLTSFNQSFVPLCCTFCACDFVSCVQLEKVSKLKGFENQWSRISINFNCAWSEQLGLVVCEYKH